MNKRHNSIKDDEPVERANKKLEHLKREVKDLKKGQAEIKKALTQLKKAKGLEQPTQKVKAVKKTVDEDSGELKWVAGSDEYEKIIKKLKQRKGLETGDIDKILKAMDVNKSSRQIHNDMERLAEKFDEIGLERASERKKARSNRITWKG